MTSRIVVALLLVAVVATTAAIAFVSAATWAEGIVLLLVGAVIVAVIDVRLAVRRVGRGVTSQRTAADEQARATASIIDRLSEIPPVVTEVRDSIAAVPGLLEPQLTELQQLLIDAAVEQTALSERLDGRLEGLRQDLAALPDLTEGVRRLHERLPTLRDRLLRQMAEESRHIEALLALHALLDIDLPPPFSRGWAAHGDVLLEAVRVVLTERPELILECGSGTSTVWLGYACRRLGRPHRVISLEHDPRFAEHTRQTIDRHGLTAHVDVRTAALQSYDVLDKQMLWYSVDALADVDSIDLVLVDGPPKATQPYARLPAVPLLRDRLHPGTLILLDDAKREEEEVIAKRWHEALPNSELAIDPTFARGLATLRIG